MPKDNPTQEMDAKKLQTAIRFLTDLEIPLQRCRAYLVTLKSNV